MSELAHHEVGVLVTVPERFDQLIVVDLTQMTVSAHRVVQLRQVEPKQIFYSLYPTNNYLHLGYTFVVEMR